MIVPKFSPKKILTIRVIISLIAVVGIGYGLSQFANATTAVITPNSDVTTNWAQCDGGTCSAARYTYIDEDVTSANDADYIGTGTTGSSAASAAVEFGMSTISGVSSVSSIQVSIRARSLTNANGGQLDTVSINLRINGSLQTATTVTPAYSTTSWTTYNATFNGTWTQANLDGAQVLLTRNTQGSGGNSTNWRDNVQVSAFSAVVTYSPTLQVEQGNYRFYDNADSNAPGTALAAQDTTVNVPVGEPFRLRQLLSVADGQLASGSQFSLQYGQKISTCSAASYGTITGSIGRSNPGAIANDNSVGTLAWSIPQDSSLSDDFYAVYSPSVGELSQYLWSDDYGFDIPTNATITGIEVRYEGQVEDYYYSGIIQLVKNGSLVGNQKNIAQGDSNDQFSTVDSTVALGGGSDLWGTTWSPSDINNQNFGVALLMSSSGTDNILIDSTEIVVHYSGNTAPIHLINNPSVSPTETAGAASNPTPSSGSIAEQNYSEITNVSTTTTVDAGDHILWDLPLSSGADAIGKTYCLRIVQDDGSPLDTYNFYPEVTITPPELTQANYRWFENADSATPGAPLAAQDTSATVAAETPVRLRQRLAVDTGGMPQNYQNYKLQYAEKVTTCSVASYTDISSEGVTNETFGTTAVQAGAGIKTWSNLSSMNSTDSTFSSVSSVSSDGISVGSKTATLTGYGFSIPTNAIVGGLEYTVRLNTNIPSGGSINLFVGPNNVSGSTSANQPASDGSGQTLIFGGPNYIFGAPEIAVADVNSSDFGTNVHALIKPAITDFTGISIESVSIKVYYTTPSAGSAFYDNSGVSNGVAIEVNPNDPTNSGRTALYQTYQESDPFSNPTAIPAGQDGIWDFAFTTTAAANGKTYCLRIVESDGTPLDTYTHYPEITTASPSGPTLDQMTRGGSGVINGVKQNYTW